MSVMSVKAFKRAAAVLPVEISILMRGGTGIGKSQLARQLAKDWNFNPKDVEDGGDFIDRRLAQMSEGDVIGLPSTSGGVTRFNPPDWYKDACENPRVLLLDELNRATNEVMQAAFQIVLDRSLNGWKLNPKTRVISAVNVGSQFVVNEMDPALLRRFWVADLKPTKKDWLDWAKDRGIYCDIVNFIDMDESWLSSSEKGNVDDVGPTPASWERLHLSLETAEVLGRPNSQLFKPLCLGFIGIEATSKFVEYCKTVNTQLTPEMIVSDYNENSTLRKNVLKTISKERWLSAVEQLGTYIRNVDILPDKDGLENIRVFISDCPKEIRSGFASKMCEPTKGTNQQIDVEHIKKINEVWKVLKKEIVAAYDINIETSDENENKKEKKERKSKKNST